MTRRVHGIVIDCPDPDALASFYERFLGMVRVNDEDGWVVIGDSPDRPGLAFQKIEDFRPPTWPGAAVPQQLHLDIKVDDIEAAEEHALELGASRLAGGGAKFHVFADPVGHPFCLIWD